MTEVLDEQQLETQQAEQDALGILATPEIKLPPRNPEVHQGLIISVTPQTYDSGAHSVRFALQSENNGREDNYDVFIPQAAWDNPYITSEEISKLPAPEGKTQTPKEGWGRAKQDLAEIARIAIQQGREIPRGRAANFEEYIAAIDQACSGISVVYKLAADKNPSDPRFARTLRVRGIYGPETASNPKFFKGVTKRWEDTTEQE